MKTIGYTAKGHNGEKVDVPSKYNRIAKGLVRDVLELKDEAGLHKLIAKNDYINQAEIFGSVKDLFIFNTTYNDFSSPSKKLKMRELKDNLYLNVCMYGAGKINTKKVKKVRKKSDEEIRKINKKNSKIMERIYKILQDD